MKSQFNLFKETLKSLDTINISKATKVSIHSVRGKTLNRFEVSQVAMYFMFSLNQVMNALRGNSITLRTTIDRHYC